MCDREAEVRRLIHSKVDDGEVRAHIAECSVCRETLAITSWMQELASLPLHAGPLRNPDYLWWKSRMLRRWETEHAVVKPIEVGEDVQVGIGLIGAIVMLVWLWREWQPLAAPGLALLSVMVLSGLLIVTMAVIACLSYFRTSDTASAG